MSLVIFFFKSDSTATTSVYMVYKYMFYSYIFFLGNCRLVYQQEFRLRTSSNSPFVLRTLVSGGRGGLEKKIESFIVVVVHSSSLLVWQAQNIYYKLQLRASYTPFAILHILLLYHIFVWSVKKKVLHRSSTYFWKGLT